MNDEKNPCVGDLTTEGITAFLDSLLEERNTFRLATDEVLDAEIIVGEEVNGVLAGVAGVRKHRRLPVLFIIVKSEFQRRGVGVALLEKLHRAIKGRYSFLVLTVMNENVLAIRLFKRFGYRILWEKKAVYYMICPLNKKGEVLWKILNLAVCRRCAGYLSHID